MIVMNKNSKTAAAFLAAVLLLVCAAGCTPAETQEPQSDSGGPQPSTVTDAGETGASETVVQHTATGSADWAEATTIALSGTSATVSGEGVAVSGSVVTITRGGVYLLTGDFTGSIVVTAPSGDTVELVLGGVNITGDQNAAIYCTQADKLILTLAEGTANTVADAADYTWADAVKEEPDAAIFSKKDLTIGGTGSLVVVAGYNNGIGTKDDLVIEGGRFDITAANHGIRGRDSVTIADGSFTIAAGADGIQSNNDEDVSKGWISLTGGAYRITAGNDAVQAETALSVSGGDYTLTTGGGSAATPDSTGSYKGLKAGTSLTVSGGSFAIDSADDGVHSNGDIAITGGSFTLASGDDAVHADGDLTISGGSTAIEITTSYEGLEAKTMTIADGVITLYATDDGINIAGGNDSLGGGRFGRDNFSGASSDQWLLISGGTITVRAGSDAIDVNGSGQMTGGAVDLTAALLGEGQTLDVDGTWTQTGGDLTETGGSGFGGPGGGFGGPGGGRGAMQGMRPPA